MPERAASDPAGAPASLAHVHTPDDARLAVATSIFQMLSDPTRLHLLWLLTHGESDVTALTEACGASRTAVSQHLAKLRFTGLVDARKEGRHVIYRLRGGHVTRLVREGLSHADHIVTGEPPHE
ncbi:winged helix-turn-helix transcriptional regulator [Nocardia puris]|uniref:ArsR family transcriptional regulator n=1 Tax=Nocardia puris TaxID=208602 RepID=A0A366DJI7_9NOCA|nr:metalloregulator ArsR/SmtB family transcription factor [Nocardia puris]MBF6213308.1 winged helix-turn-helix transcriptional regulator [Nocardia puris]MBF6369524.1 winged helix-turn-helix transcriptional regulator [Nocardia puris]MBF6462187.1 winged helix-turn-helix transcriptional regulator [Nocardia puris]RBO89494.1 ArsR family transcriptional regulator [Nocardia puris]